MWQPVLAEMFGVRITDMREFRPWQIIEMYDRIRQMNTEARRGSRG